MQRINVVGTSASGKSTFARDLAKVLDYPYIEMDQLFWKKDWVESSDEEFFSALEHSLEPEKWVLDGNYNRTCPIKWKKVTHIIWIDYSKTRTLVQAMTRAVKRIFSKKELWPGTNNFETFSRTFFSKESVLLWSYNTYDQNRIRYQKLMNDPSYSHIKIIQIRSPKEAKTFLASLNSKA